MTNIRIAFALLGLAGILLAPSPALSGAATPSNPLCDFNGDGMSDLGLANETGGANDGVVRNLIMSGLTISTGGFPLLLPANVEASGCGNFNGDGNDQAEILARNTSTGVLTFYKLAASGIATAPPANFVATVETAFDLVGMGKIDNNATDDLVFANPSTGVIRVVLLNTDGGGNIQALSSQFPALLSAGQSGIGVADADGDGDADIWALNTTTNVVRVILLQESSGTVSVQGNRFPFMKPAALTVKGIVPIDNDDDRADLVLENPGNGVVRVVLPNANVDGKESPTGDLFPTQMPGGFSLVATGDYDGLKQNDLMARNTSTGVLLAYLLDATGAGVDSSGGPGTPSNALTVFANRPTIP